MTKPKNVDSYIAQSPPPIQARLKTLRAAIKAVAPQAEEKISYGMPYYGYKGRLVYFAAFKHHIGLYLPPPVIANHSRDLKNYHTSKSAIRFPHAQKLPLSLVKELVTARLEINMYNTPTERR